MIHTTVLLHESIDGLNLHTGSVYVDGTLGSGGHSLLAATKGVRVIGFDQDEEAIGRAAKRLGDAGYSAIFIQASYRDIDTELAAHGVTSVDAFMLDLGLSSDQFETSGRGFSFQKNEPLLMTFSKEPASNPESERLTAREIVNTWDEVNIADIIYGYGEERYARRIAKKIVEARAIKPIETTFQLVEIIKSATPFAYHRGKIHPATRTFQALRITVNDEINALRDGLTKGFALLAPKGRMAVISFHSIEDRTVKHFYKEKADSGTASLITKKPLTASPEEIATNPRSRSAKLRIIEKA